MLTQTSNHTAPHTAAGLMARLLRDGYLPGVPLCLPPACREIDARLCRGMKCPTCRAGLRYRPFHNDGRYRVLACCPTCDFAEEA